MYKLTKKDYDEIVRLNHRNHWGFRKSMLMRACRDHKKAYEAGDERRMAMLEERLTDANFHGESGFLRRRDYEGFKALVNEEFKGD